jgi:CubicO group peptidase (beta-lactamase class C family)
VPSFDGLRRVCRDAVDRGVTPGLVVAVGVAGRNVFTEAFGHRQVDPGPLPATVDTVYDLASLTKALVTSLLAMRAVGQGQLSLDDPLLPAEGSGPTVRQTLAHAGGFVAHRPFYERTTGEPSRERRARIVALAAAEPRACPPGTRSIYSDLGFILLGDRLEQLLGARLDALAERALFGPLGLALRFGAPRGSAPLAPTQRSETRGLVMGEVDDLNCAAMEGVAGHAGLFGAAGDVMALAQALCAAWRGAHPIVPEPVLREFWSPAGVPGSTWRLGWDGPAATGSLAGTRLSRQAVGHLAFTGCSLWIDPQRETIVLVLANRVHPTVRAPAAFNDLRPALQDAALEGAGYSI